MEILRLYGWFFFIYAFLGWCGEVAFAAVREKRFVNRGFLNGPLCPIYGVGVAAIVWCGSQIENWAVLYVVSAVVTSLIELVTGYVMEKLFHTRWWDYSGMPLNIGGYICLPFSLLWGVACVIIIKGVHPAIAWVVSWLPLWLSWVLLGIFMVLLLVDLYVTVANIQSNLKKLSQLEDLARQIHELSDKVGQKISDVTLEAEKLGEHAREQAELEKRKQELERMLQEKLPGLKRHLKAFPQMTSKSFQESIQKLRNRL